MKAQMTAAQQERAPGELASLRIKLAMETARRKQLQSKVAILEQRIAELEQTIEGWTGEM